MDVGKIVSIVAFVIVLAIGLAVIIVILVVSLIWRRKRRNQIRHQKFLNETDVTYSSEGPSISMNGLDNPTYDKP